MKKLTGIRGDLETMKQGIDERIRTMGPKVDAETVQARAEVDKEIKSINRQLAQHEAQITSLEGSRGFVAAMDKEAGEGAEKAAHAGKHWVEVKQPGKLDGSIVEVDRVPGAEGGDWFRFEEGKGRVIPTDAKGELLLKNPVKSPSSPFPNAVFEPIDRAKSRLQDLENAKKKPNLSWKERGALDKEINRLNVELNTKARLSEPGFGGTENPFREARPEALLAPVHTEVAPQVRVQLEYAQKMMNELNKPGARFGDGSVALAIIGEQVKGGSTPQSIAAGTLHMSKGAEMAPKLRNMAEWRTLPLEAEQRLNKEANKIEEAIKWANRYGEGSESDRNAMLKNLPEWAQPYRGQIEQLRPAK